jgi:diguanylate cyclase (GGDEF)-like protein
MDRQQGKGRSRRDHPRVAHQLDYRRDFVVPIMAIIALAALAISLMLWWFSVRADQQEYRTEKQAVGIAIQSHLIDMKHYLTDCAAWDLGYTKMVLALDRRWADENIGPYLFKTQQFENSFIIDAHNRTVYASSGPSEARMDAYRFLGDPLRAAVAAIRARPAGQDRRFVGLVKTAGGNVAAFAVAPIVPENKRIARAEGLSLLVFVDELQTSDVVQIGLLHQLQGLHQTSLGQPTDFVLRDAQGTPIGGLSWTPRRPGAALRFAGAPIILVVLAFLVLAAARVLERARRAQAQVQQLATYDSLTGLRNRASLVSRLDDLVGAQTPFALLSIDLDRFKAVNDQYGHLIGDDVLVAVAGRLAEQASSGDLLARIGGDEFVMVLVEDDVIGRARTLGAAIVAALERPITTDRVRAHIGASVGTALYPGNGHSAEDVRQAADLALYRAKQQGRGNACFYSVDMDEAAHDRRLLEAALRQAIEHDAIGLAFQPVICLATDQVTSFEALARWTHPERGPIAPCDFIGLAEECGLIEALGAKLLRKACAEAATWPDRIRVAVNLSALQFRSGRLCSVVGEVLVETGLAPHRLQLEVTETVLIHDAEGTFAQLQQLRQLGIEVLMDDFGAGYSSLSYFERFLFDKVKIDRSFIAKAPASPTSQAIIKAVVQLGTALKLDIVAEGVETDQQKRMLSTYGCTHAQGYLLGRPMPAELVDGFLAERSTGVLDEKSDQTSRPIGIAA